MILSNKDILAYSLLWLFISLCVFSVTVWFSNWDAIFLIFSLNEITFIEKFQFLFSFYGSIETNFSAISATATILISILFGLTVVLFIHYVKIMRGFKGIESVGATSIGGIVSGFFGIGCASCGSIILVALLSQIGAGGVLFLLPFGGEEFSFIAVILLGYSVYILLKKIHSPQVCEIE